MVFTGVVMVLALLNVAIHVKYVPAAWKPCWLNLNAIGLGYIAPSPAMPIAMACGWIAGCIWLCVS